MKKRIITALNNLLVYFIVFSILGMIMKIYDSFTKTIVVSFISGILFVLILFVHQLVKDKRIETKSREDKI